MMCAGRDGARTGGASGAVRSTLAYASALLCIVVWTGCSADAPSTPPRPTASPPPNPTTLSGISISSPELVLSEGETADIVITLDSDPGTDIEVWFRRGWTGAEDLAFAPERVAWAAAEWQEPRMLAVTASIDELAERLETHELQVWTYRGGEVGADRQILRKVPIRVWVKDPPGIRAFIGGGAGEVVLEWPGWGGPDIERWQYRSSSDYPYDWGPWTDMPDSDADTRRLRVTGHPMLGTIYFFQIRPWGASGPGAASAVIDGWVAEVGPDGIPGVADVPQPLEPGRRFDGGSFTFVVPDGMLVSTGITFDPRTRNVYLLLYDETTLAHMVVLTHTAEVVQKTSWDARSEVYRTTWTKTGNIAESRHRAPPPPGHDLEALWDAIEQSIKLAPLP